MEKEIIEFKKNGIPVKIRSISMHQNSFIRGIHSHTAIEVVKVKSGILNCSINNKTITADNTNIIFINSNIQHRLFSENADIVYLNIDVNRYTEKSNYDEFASLYDFISFSKSEPYMLLKDNEKANDILSKLIYYYNETEQSSEWYLKAYIYLLIAFLYSKSFITPIVPSTLKIDKIKPFVRYINENFKSNITLDDICSVAKYNKYAVCHAFKLITGSTIFEYKNFLRVHYAIERFKENNSTVLEIATESGFSSVAYFDKVFKNVIGCSPSVYRKHLF